MADRSRLLLWLTVALIYACAAGASFAAPRSPHRAEASKSEKKASTSDNKKRSKAERRAEERRAREQRSAPDAVLPESVAAPSAVGEGATPPTGADDVAVEGAIAEGAGAVSDDPTAPPADPADAAPVPPDLDVDPAPATAAGDVEPADVESVPLDADVEASSAPVPDQGPDPAKLLADSLATYESAQSLWEQGLVDEAFAALDAAYELMAAVDVERDPLRTQEKEDLRRLISRRVVEIYASRPTAAGDLEGSIPLEINEHVQREILSFSGPERQFFLDAYARGGLYRSMILDELRAAGMPLELAWMPIVESGFKVRAYSVARALGLWQFIASTGYRFGLERTTWIDERMDPHKSTKAAIGYLTELHALFGDWLTALAAYNCGEHLVLRLLSSQPVSYFDRFWDLYERLPRETRRYVPRFLAVRAILEDPAAYGFTLPEPEVPPEFDVVRTERTVDLGELERRLQLADGTIKGLNPELRRNATPSEPYEVKVPRGTTEQVAAAITQLPHRVVTADVAPSGGGGTHRVRPGETLSRVASRYGTSVEALVALNGLQSKDRIWPGQTLRVRSGGGRSSSRSDSGKTSSAATASGNTTHRVRQGDNLWLIAQRYGTTVERIKVDNGLRGNLLRVGQKLVIRREGVSTGG
ncbi:MAG TPA: LysM peptidoglycan-binding domain-containing protein [Thermoanaerobaculia bacterium]|nr:LysM peptidoglycan-binding domain-containing protein [Thermoanaerobaculia bacterium]